MIERIEMICFQILKSRMFRLNPKRQNHLPNKAYDIDIIAYDIEVLNTGRFHGRMFPSLSCAFYL